MVSVTNTIDLVTFRDAHPGKFNLLMYWKLLKRECRTFNCLEETLFLPNFKQQKKAATCFLNESVPNRKINYNQDSHGHQTIAAQDFPLVIVV